MQALDPIVYEASGVRVTLVIEADDRHKALGHLGMPLRREIEERLAKVYGMDPKAPQPCKSCDEKHGVKLS